MQQKLDELLELMQGLSPEEYELYCPDDLRAARDELEGNLYKEGESEDFFRMLQQRT